MSSLGPLGKASQAKFIMWNGTQSTGHTCTLGASIYSETIILLNRLAMWGSVIPPALPGDLSQVKFLPSLMVFGLPSASHFGMFSWCGEFWADLFSQCSLDRVSDDGSDTVVSASRYSIFCNTVRMSKGAFTIVNPRGDSLARLQWCFVSGR